MLVKIEARILIFQGTDFHFPSTSVPPGTFLGSACSVSVVHERTCASRILSHSQVSISLVIHVMVSDEPFPNHVVLTCTNGVSPNHLSVIVAISDRP